MALPLLAMSITTAVIAVIEVSLFGFLGNIVDWLSTQSPETLLKEQAGTLLWMGAILLLLLPLLIFLHAALVHQSLLGNYPMSIRWVIHRYLLHQSLSFFQDEFAGRIATKVMQTALATRETVMKVLDIMVYVGVYFISMVVLVASLHPALMIPLLIWLGLYIGIQLFFLPRLRAVSTEQAHARATMTGRIVDTYTNILTVKLFADKDQELGYAKDSMGGFLETVYQQMRLVTGLSVSVHIINYALVFFIALLAMLLWKSNLVTVGAIAIAVSLALRLNGMAQWIMWEVSAIFEHIGTVLDGAKTLSAPLQVQDTPQAKTLEVTQGHIEFKNVHFAYDKTHPVFKGFNLKITAGEKVGIVGRSGAGKSTFVNILLRFYDIQSGEILIDQQALGSVTQESLRRHIGVVTQDTSLMHRSIRENIAYGQPQATESQVLAAAQKAQAHEFILGLTDPSGRKGFDAHVGERGVKLSGGQRQRIAIARVLLKDAPILILDEATSALDSEVEAIIQTQLKQLMENKTVIAIAHRLSTIAEMDRLIVLDQGELVEEGTHDELIAREGLYAMLWKRQSGGFLLD
jgi:ATP-binding cassette subfamily B multidrug efflux pump